MQTFKQNILRVALLILIVTGYVSPAKKEAVPIPQTGTASAATAPTISEAKELPPLSRSLFFEISDVKVFPKTFNPSEGEGVILHYRLSRPARSMVRIFDPEMRLLKVIPGKIDTEVHEVVWDGRDRSGAIVPDEAYSFTIEAMNRSRDSTFYDSTSSSVGENTVPLQVSFDKNRRIVSYRLSKDARVLIRVGIPGGPLLKTIVNGSPRRAGNNEEVWDGKDESGTFFVLEEKDYRFSAEASSLEENSILTAGNKNYNYTEYKTEVAVDRPLKEEQRRPSRTNRVLLKEEKKEAPLPSGKTFTVGIQPKFKLELAREFLKTGNGLPLIKGKIPIRISLDERIKRFATEQRYEVLLYVDFKFVAEGEEGYSPSTLMWETRNVENGQHIITVNVRTLTGQVSSASIIVMVEN